uniref:Uncharacterized protein n=1 Tax=viral metagenome TaxID=1070528 RepID=A0A6M3JYF6_9ZZZZ
MGCGVYWQQIRTAERALGDLDRLGLGPGTEAYEAVLSQRGKLLAQVGMKFPRIDYSLSMWREFSPQRIRAWFDPEFGFMVEGRASPGAPPVYKTVSAEMAAAVIKGELTPEMKEALVKPDEYLGE